MPRTIIITACILTLYTYVLFPLILFCMGKMARLRKETKPASMKSQHPRVAIICAMYNEEAVVREKIQNFNELQYDDLHFYIGSDGSTDNTNAIIGTLTANDKIRYCSYPRRGKVHVINDLIEQISEDIIVFTDANSMFEHDAISRLIDAFKDLGVGAVCGRLKLVSKQKQTGEGFYWRYETAIKKMESDLGCVIGANGAIYAVRKHLLERLPNNTINDDFTISMRVLEKGYAVKYAPDAVARETLPSDDSAEFRRHIRDGAGHYRALLHLYRLLNPFRFKVFFLYVSHRVIRWFVPFLLIIMLIAPLFALSEPFMRCFLASEIFFYLLVLIGWVTKTRIKSFYIPYYFIYINIALFIGFIKNILGIQKAAWSSTSR